MLVSEREAVYRERWPERETERADVCGLYLEMFDDRKQAHYLSYHVTELLGIGYDKKIINLHTRGHGLCLLHSNVQGSKLCSLKS